MRQGTSVWKGIICLPVFTDTAICTGRQLKVLWASEYLGAECADPEEGFLSLLLKRVCSVLRDLGTKLGLECKLKPCNQTHAEAELLRLKYH